MRLRAGLLGATAALVLVTAGCGGGQTTTVAVTVTTSETVTVTAPGSEPGLGPPGERTEYGHIVSLERSGDGYTMTFDPALFLTGEAANAAAAEDGVVAPGEAVPNDNYAVDETHRAFTFPVAADAAVTVLVRGGEPEEITVEELARALRQGGSGTMWDPHTTGTWITTDIDTVVEIRQQYHP